VAYIVCTVATPPTNGGSVVSPSVESSVARLKNTERQFRQASILAALDLDALQLITFYKKVDVVKDQRTLLNKFGFILRSNACTIAYKTATRVPDLLKPENARLYRLFITAVMSSIKLSPSLDTRIQSIGPRLYLVEGRACSADTEALHDMKTWFLFRVDLQVILSGHIILTIASNNDLRFNLMADVAPPLLREHSETLGPMTVYLAPVGQIARVATGVSETPSSALKSNTTLSDVRKDICKEMLPAWLKDQMNNPAYDVQQSTWIEVEIPVLEDDGQSGSSKASTKSNPTVSRSLIWKSVFWPADLCFCLEEREVEQDQDQCQSRDEDPLQFVEDWMMGASDRAAEADDEEKHEGSDDDEPLFGEDGAFDDPEHFQPFGPPAFPASSQAIYPTPPDVVMTHPTPGMSSIDGVGMTPANVIRPGVDTVPGKDSEMPDFGEVEAQASGVGSGFYDEDLFEEMPDDNFGQEGAGEEPNWDFFDQPDFDLKQTKATESKEVEERHSADMSITDLPIEPSTNGREREEATSRQGPDSVSQSQQDLDDKLGHQEKTSGDASLSTGAGMVPAESARAREPQEVPGAGSASVVSHQGGPDPLRSSHSIDRHSSSRYEGVRPEAPAVSWESKYAANGQFWFDPKPLTARYARKSAFDHGRQQTPSRSSDSGSSSDTGSMALEVDDLAPRNDPLARPWTEYTPEPPKEAGDHAEMDVERIRNELAQLLALLKPNGTEVPSIRDFSLMEKSKGMDSIPAEKLPVLAQVLVDQMTQTSLLQNEDVLVLQRHGAPHGLEVTADLSGINTTASFASLSQLISTRHASSNAKSQGRISKIIPAQISLRRADQPLTASISILPFWETLNLQPKGPCKDVTSFCIHPAGSNLSAGSSNFLQRIADAYTACALGTHVAGRIAGLTNDGLVSWSADDSLTPDLDRTCERLGKAMASASGLHGSVVVYMIASGTTSASCLGMCSAFYTLFESFRKSLPGQHNGTDIALQVIPHSFVASADTVVVPPQSAYNKLAIDVYNRLPPAEAHGRLALCESAVMLAKSDTVVTFHLAASATSPLSKNRPCLHVAYAVSPDHRWISAVWTDNLGHIALTMCYCLRFQSSDRTRPRKDIFKDIWELSHDIMSKERGQWRLVVARQGWFESEEVDEWLQLAAAGTRASPMHQPCPTVLLSVELEPLLKISPPSGPLRSGQAGLFSQQSNMNGTPASTPQASTMSPDQLVPATPTPGGSAIVNAATPPEHGFDPNNESDLTLADPLEESWAVVLPYGVNQTQNMIEVRPAMASGLLVKRAGPKDEDGVITFGVHLINTSSSTTAAPAGTANSGSADGGAEELLEDIINDFRGLVTLAATRGCIDGARECVPWHVATAVKACRVLDQVM